MKKFLNTCVLFVILWGYGNSQSTYYVGEFKLRKIITLYDTLNIFTNYLGYSNLYEDSVSSNESWRSANLGDVKLNNVSLSYNSSINTYLDTLNRRNNSEIIWKLTGASSYPSFTVSCNDTFPSFSKTNILPDTLHKSSAFEVILNGLVSRADTIELVMFDGNFRTEMPYNKKVGGNATSISIPNSDLSTLADSGGISVLLSLVSTEYKVLDGKRFKFEKRTDLLKRMPIVLE